MLLNARSCAALVGALLVVSRRETESESSDNLTKPVMALKLNAKSKLMFQLRRGPNGLIQTANEIESRKIIYDNSDGFAGRHIPWSPRWTASDRLPRVEDVRKAIVPESSKPIINDRLVTEWKNNLIEWTAEDRGQRIVEPMIDLRVLMYEKKIRAYEYTYKHESSLERALRLEDCVSLLSLAHGNEGDMAYAKSELRGFVGKDNFRNKGYSKILSFLENDVLQRFRDPGAGSVFERVALAFDARDEGFAPESNLTGQTIEESVLRKYPQFNTHKNMLKDEEIQLWVEFIHALNGSRGYQPFTVVPDQWESVRENGSL